METAKQNTQQNIEENDALKQFMGLLNRQGMGEQSQDFMELFQYVAGMQLQLAVMTDELQGVKEQLSQLRENQPKTVTESLVDKVTHLQEKIANLSERLSAVKDHLAETATQAFNAFKEKGKAEMCKVLQKGISGVKSVLADCREHLVDVMMDYKKTANQIDSIGDELKQIGNSVSNVGSLVNVRGMDAAEIMEALSAMNDDDRLSVAAYLESRGAWTTEIANEETREFGEYHLDVRYITDTNEIIDLKKEMAWEERAKEPIGADDVILKITHAEGFEIERITNKTPEEVQEIMGALTKLEEKDRKNIHDCLESYGADYIPIIVDGGRNSGMPQFNDFEIDLNKKEVVMMNHLSPAQQAEGIINRLEYAKTAFSDDERNLIVNYAYKLNDMEKTRELVSLFLV